MRFTTTSLFSPWLRQGVAPPAAHGMERETTPGRSPGLKCKLLCDHTSPAHVISQLSDQLILRSKRTHVSQFT